MNSIVNTGLSGMLNSHRSMQQSAHNIASSQVVTPNQASPNQNPKVNGMTEPSSTVSAVLANNGVNAPNDVSRGGVISPSESVGALSQTQNLGDSARDLINLQQQKQLFTASARVVEVGAQAVGRLIDDYS